MFSSGYPQVWENTVPAPMASGTGGRENTSSSGRPERPSRTSASDKAFQKAALAARISGKLYMGRLAVRGDIGDLASWIRAPMILSYPAVSEEPIHAATRLRHRRARHQGLLAARLHELP